MPQAKSLCRANSPTLPPSGRCSTRACFNRLKFNSPPTTPPISTSSRPPSPSMSHRLIRSLFGTTLRIPSTGPCSTRPIISTPRQTLRANSTIPRTSTRSSTPEPARLFQSRSRPIRPISASAWPPQRSTSSRPTRPSPGAIPPPSNLEPRSAEPNSTPLSTPWEHLSTHRQSPHSCPEETGRYLPLISLRLTRPISTTRPQPSPSMWLERIRLLSGILRPTQCSPTPSPPIASTPPSLETCPATSFILRRREPCLMRAHTLSASPSLRPPTIITQSQNRFR